MIELKQFNDLPDTYDVYDIQEDIEDAEDTLIKLKIKIQECSDVLLSLIDGYNI